MIQNNPFKFYGGVDVSGLQLASPTPLSLPLPENLFLPLSQHIGHTSQPIVEVGQRVSKFECIAIANGYVSAHLHAPTSGIVAAIGECPSNRFGAEPVPCVELAVDGFDQARSLEALELIETNSTQHLYERIREAGIVGMGGGGFPVHVKIREGMAQHVRLLIINGVECEPNSHADVWLMQHHARDLSGGISLLKQLLLPESTVLACQQGMQEILEPLRAELDDDVSMTAVPQRYPSGSEKQLIQALINVEVPNTELPIHSGVVCLNVATVVAIYRAVRFGEPSISRYVTINTTQCAVANVLIGTPMAFLFAHHGILDFSNHVITSGGAMMGREIADPATPVVKTTNEVAAVGNFSAHEDPRECIHCGECVSVCPVRLQPQKLYEYARISALDSVQDYGLFDCIECGCCAYVCPSHIPLVHYYRHAKAEVDVIAADLTLRDLAAKRYERHLLRREKYSQSDQRTQLAETAILTDETIDNELSRAIARNKTRRDKDPS